MAKFFFIVLTLVAAIIMVTAKTKFDKICFDRLPTTGPAEVCTKKCKGYYKDRLIRVIPPNPNNNNCMCKYHCFPYGEDCFCTPSIRTLIDFHECLIHNDHAQDQEMELEALEAILADDFQEIHPSESGLNTSNRCYQITMSPQDDEDAALPPATSVCLGLIFSHTEKYPDEPPLLNVTSLKGIAQADLKILKEKLEQEASENLGMAMVYTLVSSAKEWLCERFAQEAADDAEEEIAAKDEVVVPHGEAVTVESFLAWRERFEAELALEKAKLMPEAALSAVTKEKKLTGRQWFESGRASKGAAAIAEGSDVEDEEDIDLDDEDFEDDEEDMLEHYLAEKPEN